MSISRRNFIKLLAGATAAAAGIGVPAILYLTQEDDEKEDTASQSATPTPSPKLPPDMSDIIPSLMAATEALFINYDIEPTHYEAFFRYRAASADGYLALYEHFVSTLDSDAQNMNQSTFLDSDTTTQRTILDAGLNHIINNDFQDASGNILTDAPTWEHYARFFLREALTLFMFTDAWIAIGYDGWPGRARGLDLYRKPLPSINSQLIG